MPHVDTVSAASMISHLSRSNDDAKNGAARQKGKYKQKERDRERKKD